MSAKYGISSPRGDLKKLGDASIAIYKVYFKQRKKLKLIDTPQTLLWSRLILRVCPKALTTLFSGKKILCGCPPWVLNSKGVSSRPGVPSRQQGPVSVFLYLWARLEQAHSGGAAAWVMVNVRCSGAAGFLAAHDMLRRCPACVLPMLWHSRRNCPQRVCEVCGPQMLGSA